MPIMRCLPLALPITLSKGGWERCCMGVSQASEAGMHPRLQLGVGLPSMNSEPPFALRSFKKEEGGGRGMEDCT